MTKATKAVKNTQSIKKDYAFLEHKHRFAAWCAATAASASPKCRFTVKQGFELLGRIGMATKAQEQVWKQYQSFDDWHGKSCADLMGEAKSNGMKGFSYGVAAKMINCYIKAFYIGDQEVLSVAHPPIDRLLLSELAKKDYEGKRKIWYEYKNKGWSTFTKDHYSEVIKALRSSKELEAEMWKVERYWLGYKEENGSGQGGKKNAKS